MSSSINVTTLQKVLLNVSPVSCAEHFAHSQYNPMLITYVYVQGILTEREGSVRLTSFH
jgi:hypothetical protein